MRKLLLAILLLTGLAASAQNYNLNYPLINAGVNTSSVFNVKGILNIRGITIGTPASDSVVVVVNGQLKKVAPVNLAGQTLQVVTNNGATTTNPISITTSTAGSTFVNGLSFINSSTTAGSNVPNRLAFIGNFGSSTSGFTFGSTPGAGNTAVLNVHWYNGTTYAERFRFLSNGNLNQYNPSAFSATISPSLLTANRTINWPDASGTVMFDISTGTFGSGGTSSLGAGTRFMWYPRKSAIRAGTATSTNWDDASIGNYSAAFGNGTNASGAYSFAMGGTGTTASGDYSTAFGNNSQASGTSSFATGSATASGFNSTAMGGGGTIASQTGAVAIGSNENYASGQYSIALGRNVSTNGMTGSFIIGDDQGSDHTSTMSSNTAEFTARFYNGYRFVTDEAATTGVFIDNAGNLTANNIGGGVFTIPIRDIFSPAISFASAGVVSHYTRVGDQVTLDLTVEQTSSNWIAGDAFNFVLDDLPYSSNFNLGADDITGSMVLKKSSEGAYPVFNGLDISGSSNEIVVSGTYGSTATNPGVTNPTYSLHIVYTIN